MDAEEEFAYEILVMRKSIARELLGTRCPSPNLVGEIYTPQLVLLP